MSHRHQILISGNMSRMGERRTRLRNVPAEAKEEAKEGPCAEGTLVPSWFLIWLVSLLMDILMRIAH